MFQLHIIAFSEFKVRHWCDMRLFLYKIYICKGTYFNFVHTAQQEMYNYLFSFGEMGLLNDLTVLRHFLDFVLLERG